MPKRNLTDHDLELIKDLIDIELDEKLEAKLKEKLALLPSKDEFFSSMSELMEEIKATREEITTLSQHSKDHTDQLESHETRITNLEAVATSN